MTQPAAQTQAPSSSLRLGWIGTGIMGGAICGRLLDAGFPLFHPLRPHLGTLAASAVIEPSATPTFTLTPTYHPDLDPQGKAYFASPRAILEAPDLPVDLGAWRSGAEAFIDALTTGLVGDLLAKLPFLGGIDAEDIGFFTTLANLFGDINLDSPDTFRTSLANLAGATAGLRIVSAAGAAHDVIEWSKLAADDAVRRAARTHLCRQAFWMQGSDVLIDIETIG